LLLAVVAVPQKPVTPTETVTVAMARRRLFRAEARFTLVVALVRPTLPAAICPVAMAVVVLVAMVLAQLQVLLAQPTPEAVVVALMARLLLEQAALASSFSSTTSALPQSSPSSHRRSGLHQRVR